MSDIREELKYASTHEWARVEDDGTITIGISDHAQDALGDIVYVEHPEAGQEVVAGQEVAVVESVKAASDIYAPISGSVVSVNEDLEDAPELVNQDPYGEAGFFGSSRETLVNWMIYLMAKHMRKLVQTIDILTL